MLNVFICDDEQSYLNIISDKIEKCLSEKLNMDSTTTCFSSIDELSSGIKESKADILFLDVVVNNVNAIEWLIEHQHEFKALPIIIMTAFPFETDWLSDIDCCYYMIKSKMTDDQLLRAIRRSVAVVAQNKPKYETVSIGKKSYTINLENILFIETMNNSIIIHMVDGTDITVYTTLKKFAESLPPNFLRCHKSYMVNMNYISGFEPHFFTLKSGNKISIPPKKYKDTVETYKKYLLSL